MALRPLGRKDNIRKEMSIQIDKQKFKAAIKKEFERRAMADNLLEFADEMLDVMQKWFDLGEWKDKAEIDSSREVRILMRLYIMSELKQDSSQSWFTASHIWVFLVRQLSVWTVKKVVEEYWPKMAAEKGLTPKE
tara:strand:- start:145 stop:549 length:405 start_codon:yes stop_codon:yes gene_type:complete